MRAEGEVTWFNERKGFGFIKGDDGLELFVHYTEITRDGFQTLEPGQRVSYEVTDKDRGPRAVEVQVVGETTHGTFL